MVRTRRRPSDALDALPENMVQAILVFLGIDDLKRLTCTVKASRYRRNFTYLAGRHLVRRMTNTRVLHRFYQLNGYGGFLISRVKKTRFAARCIDKFPACCHHIYYGASNAAANIMTSTESHKAHREGRCCLKHMPYTLKAQEVISTTSLVRSHV